MDRIIAGIKMLNPEFKDGQIFSALKFIAEKGFYRTSEDYSNYEAGQSCDGGKYGFWTNAILHELGEDMWFELEERTTCDAFQFCSSCGSFNTHENCEPSELTI